MLKDFADKAKEKLEEQANQIKKLKDKAMDKISEAGDDLKELKDKAHEKIDEKGDELKEMTGKTLDKFKLEHLVPEIQIIVKNKVLPLLHLDTLSKSLIDNKIETVFQTAYEFLPMPVRLIISKEAFVKFCISNKSKLLDKDTEKKLNEIKAKTEVQTQKFSNADEILKLKQLLDAGVLTQEEFILLKKKLLDS
jgi:hypothetical protein